MPIFITILFTIWAHSTIAHKLAEEQGIIKENEKNTVFKFLVPNLQFKYTENSKDKD